MTLATLQAQHPDWCFKCGATHPHPNSVCPWTPDFVIAALKEELVKTEEKLDAKDAQIKEAQRKLLVVEGEMKPRRRCPRCHATMRAISYDRPDGIHCDWAWECVECSLASARAALAKAEAELEALRAERGKEKP